VIQDHNNFSHSITMERLFSPCTRLFDLLEYRYQGDFDDETSDALLHINEINLNVSTDDFLSAERAFTYTDLHAMLGDHLDTVAWLTPHATVARHSGRVKHAWDELVFAAETGDTCRFPFRADGKDIIALARSSEHLLEICDVVLRLMAASDVHSVMLDGTFINAPTLAYLMEHCQSLKNLKLNDLETDENHCRVLGVFRGQTSKSS
jgi:hypothetical protein